MNSFIHLNNPISFNERVSVTSVTESPLSFTCEVKNELLERPNHGLVVGDIIRCERLFYGSFLCVVYEINGNNIVILKNEINGKGVPVVGDSFIRFGNIHDKTRQGNVTMEQAYGVASINVYDGVDDILGFKNKEVVKIGFLGGIYDSNLGLIEGYGAYIKNGFFTGKIHATEGSNVYTKEEIDELLLSAPKPTEGNNTTVETMSDWRAKAYKAVNADVLVFYDSKIYALPKGSTALAVDIPGISQKWILKVSGGSGGGNVDSSFLIGLQYHTNFELLESLGITGGLYLTLDGEKIWAGNSDRWNGLLQPDYINQPVRTTDNVTFKNVTATNTINSLIDNTDVLNATTEVNTNVVNATSAVNTGILNADIEVNTDVVNATSSVNTAIVDATDRVLTDTVLADSLVQTVMVKTTSVRAEDISSSFFMSGFAGTGYRLSKDENQNFLLELDRLTVRKDFTVYELIVSQIRATNGSLWVSDAIKIEDVTKVNDNYVCSIDTDGGTIYVPFVVNDIVRCQKFNGKNLKYYTGKVLAADYNDGTFTVQVIEGSNFPEPKDELVRMGNSSDLTRQGAIYLTSSDNGAPFIDVIDGVTNASLANKTKVRMGKLNGIVDPDLGALSGYGLYAQGAYIKGKLHVLNGSNVYTKTESDTQITEIKNSMVPFVTITGEQVFTYTNDITVDKESITLEATELNFTADPADRKWEYINISNSWQEVPNTFNTLTYTLRHDSSIWEGRDAVTVRYRVTDKYDQITIFKVYDGKGELTVVITSDYGDLFINGNINTVLRANVYWGGNNITDTLANTAFQWFRKSSYGVNEDDIWNQNNKNKKNVEIFGEDVYKKAVFECEVTVDI